MMAEQYVATTLLSWLNNIVDNVVHACRACRQAQPALFMLAELNPVHAGQLNVASA